MTLMNFCLFDKENAKKNAWEEIEKKIGIIFPEDYKRFIDFHGEGGINEFLWIFNVMKDAYISMQSEFPEQFSFDFYNGKTGLFPWGITDNGDELFWNYKGDIVEIVVYESRYANNMSYIMSMEDFLCGLLSKEIVCPIFPDDFILEKNYYETI